MAKAAWEAVDYLQPASGSLKFYQPGRLYLCLSANHGPELSNLQTHKTVVWWGSEHASADFKHPFPPSCLWMSWGWCRPGFTFPPGRGRARAECVCGGGWKVGITHSDRRLALRDRNQGRLLEASLGFSLSWLMEPFKSLMKTTYSLPSPPINSYAQNSTCYFQRLTVFLKPLSGPWMKLRGDWNDLNCVCCDWGHS